MKNAGIVLAVIGLIMMLYTGYNYVTEKPVVDIGKLKINKEEKHTVRWSPLVGGILFIGGLLIMISTPKKEA